MFNSKDSGQGRKSAPPPEAPPELIPVRTFVVTTNFTEEGKPEQVTVYAHEVHVSKSGALVFQTAWFIGQNVVQGSRRGFNVWVDYEQIDLADPTPGLIVQ